MNLISALLLLLDSLWDGGFYVVTVSARTQGNVCFPEGCGTRLQTDGMSSFLRIPSTAPSSLLLLHQSNLLQLRLQVDLWKQKVWCEASASFPSAPGVCSSSCEETGCCIAAGEIQTEKLTMCRLRNIFHSSIQSHLIFMTPQSFSTVCVSFPLAATCRTNIWKWSLDTAPFTSICGFFFKGSGCKEKYINLWPQGGSTLKLWCSLNKYINLRFECPLVTNYHH